MSQLKGSGGKPKTPPSPTNTPDNLRSEDVVEMVMGISEGPIQGLSNGDKSFYVGDTVLERLDGGRNFEEFDIKVLPGGAEPDPIVFKLGGEASNTQVGVSLAYNVPVTRQTQTGNIDAIDIRLVVQSLYKSVQEGKSPGVFDHTFEFKIRYKPLSASVWGDWYEAKAFTPGNGNPNVNYYDSSWSENSYKTGDTWYDPADPSRTWSPISGFTGAINWQTSQPGYSNPGNLRITGKTTSTYVKEYRIPVQRIPEPYQIQIQRMTADSSTGGGDPQYIAEVTWESFQVIDKLPKRYPYTAMVQISGRSTDQFSSIPQMSGIYKGLMVRVPTNYNPVTHVYTGVWDGSWKTAWTNSPVWLLYEAIHNDRWGWSAYSPVNWSKYEAYELAQICDQALSNGQPRYTFNANITDPMDGREFCRYMAGSFNSVIVDDNNGNVRVLMDKDDVAVDLIGPESIVGDFEYTFTDVNTRFNDITVVFRNKETDYNEDRRRVKSDEQIEQFGRIPFDFVAVGTTNENEAVRKASRRLVSATTETEMVNFKTNRRASNWSPYEILLITDPYKGYGHSGRFLSIGTSSATLRDAVYLEAGVPYKIDISTDTGPVERTLTGVTTGWTKTFNFTTPLPAGMYSKSQFSLKHLESYGLPKPYRILNLQENDVDDWSVMAIEVNRLKFAAEDDAEVVGEPVYSAPVDREPARPTDVKLTNMSRAAEDGTMIYEARVDFRPAEDGFVKDYRIRYRLVGETEYEVREVDGSGVLIQLPRAGDWEFQVQSRNVWQQQSPWISPVAGPLSLEKTTPITGGGITSVVGGLNQITVKVQYPDQTDVRYARLYASATNSVGTAVYITRSDTDTLVHTNLSGVVTNFYWVKFEDNLGNIGDFPTSVGISGTTTQAQAGDIANGAISITKFASGINVPTVVATLPTVGNYEGRIVTLTTDGKIYRYYGGVWRSDVSAADIAGTIAGTQIANGAIGLTKFATGLTPVEIVSSLPVSGNFEGRQVAFGGKLYRYTGGAFVTGVAAADVSGLLNSSQLNIQIGGDNLLSNSSFEKQTSVSDFRPTGWSIYNNGAIAYSFLDIPGRRSGKAYGLKALAAGVSTFGVYTNSGVEGGGVKGGWLPNTTYILSFYAKKVGGASWTNMALGWNNAPTETWIQRPNLSTSWQRYVVKLTTGAIPEPNGGFFITVNGNTAINSEIHIDDVQVEQGDIVTAYAPRTDEILPGSITSVEVSDDAITAPKILAGAIVAGKLAANSVATANLIAGAVTAEKILANTITAAQIAADTITAAQIAAGAITTNELAANSVTASKMLISSTENMLQNADYIAGMDGWTVHSNGVSDIATIYTDNSTANGWPSPRAMYLQRGTGGSVVGVSNGTQSANGPGGFEMKVGDEVYFEATLYHGDGSNVHIEMVVVRPDGATATLAPTNIQNTTSNGVRISSTGTNNAFVPIKASFKNTAHNGRAFLYIYNFAATGSGLYVWSPTVRRRNTGALLVDGAVTANSIAAGAVKAIHIEADTITAAQIAAGAIGADEIAANAITAGKLAAGSVTARSMIITGGGFINHDPMLKDPSAWYWEGAHAPTFVTISDAPMGTSVIRSTNGIQNQGGDYNYYVIDPSKKYRFSFYARRSSDCNGTLYSTLRQFVSPGQPTGLNGGRQPYKPTANATLSTSWVEYSAEFGPASSGDWQTGMKMVAMDWLINYGGTAGYMEICYPRLEEMVSAELIVNGAITANKLNVGQLSAITADLGNITAGTLTFTNASYKRVDGAALGVNSDILMWFGPTSIANASVSKTNGVFCLANDGKVYYGATELGGSAGLQITATGSVSGGQIGGGNIGTNAATVSVTGGNSGASIQWVQVDGDTGWTIGGNTSFSTSFFTYVPPGGSKQAVFMAVVSKNGQTATALVTAYAMDTN